MNKKKLHISNDIIQWTKKLADKENIELGMYIEMVLMRHFVREDAKKNN